MGVAGAAESTSIGALVVFGTATSLLAKISARRCSTPLPFASRLACCRPPKMFATHRSAQHICLIVSPACCRCVGPMWGACGPHDWRKYNCGMVPRLH